MTINIYIYNVKTTKKDEIDKATDDDDELNDKVWHVESASPKVEFAYFLFKGRKTMRGKESEGDRERYTTRGICRRWIVHE